MLVVEVVTLRLDTCADPEVKFVLIKFVLSKVPTVDVPPIIFVAESNPDVTLVVAIKVLALIFIEVTF